MAETVIFYMFATVLVASAVLVISTRNPVHAVLFLILAFFNAAGLFLLLGAEFLAMLLVIVYVGAVAVLFLFVVMMLDINYVQLRQGFLHYLPIGAIIGLVLLAELALIAGSWHFAAGAPLAVGTRTPDPGVLANTQALGRLIYTDYVFLFQSAGLILLVAMSGTILLTLRSRAGVRRQSVARQTARDKTSSVEIRKIPSGGGI